MKKLPLLVLLSFCLSKAFTQVAQIEHFGGEKSFLAFLSSDTLLTCRGYYAKISNGLGKPLNEVTFPFEMRAADFSYTKKLIAVGGNYGEFRVWNLKGQLIKNFYQFGFKRYHITAVSFSSDGSKIVVGTQKNIAFVWRLNGELIGTIDLNRNLPTEEGLEEVGAFPQETVIDTNLADNRGISCLKFSNDGDLIFVASHDGRKMLWNLNCQPIYSLAEPSKTVKVVDFSLSDEYILTGHEDGSVMMWNKKGELIHQTKNQFPILRVKFAEDGKKYLYGDTKAWVTTKDFQGYTLDKELLSINPSFTAHSIGDIDNLVFSKDNNRVLLSDYFKKIKLWKISEQKNQEVRINAGYQYISSIAFAPNGKFFVSSNDYDKRATLYDLNFTPLYEFDKLDYKVNVVAFAPDGNTILVGGENTAFSQWSLNGNLIQQFNGQEGSIQALTFSPDGKLILSGSRNSTVILWDRDGNVIRKISAKGSITSLTFSLDGKQMLIVDSAGYVSLFSLDGEKLFQTRPNPYLNLKTARFSPDGKKIIIGTDRGPIILDQKGNIFQDLSDSKIKYRLASISKEGLTLLVGKHQMTLWGMQGNVLKTIKIDSTQGFSAVGFSPDGNTFLLAGGEGSNFEFWSKEGNAIKNFRPHRGFFGWLKFSSDNQKIITYGSEDNAIIIWNLKGTLLNKFSLKTTSRVTSCSISPKDVIYVCTMDGNLRVFDINGQLKRQLSLTRTPSNYLNILVSPDEKFVISTDTTNSATIQNIEPGKGKTVILNGHKSPISSVAFSPDGNYVLTGSKDTTAILWNTEGQMLRKLIGHKHEINEVVFSPNGELLATISKDNWIFVWDKAGNRVGEIFTGEEYGFTLAFSLDSKTIFAESHSDTNAIFQYSFKGGKIKKLPRHQWPVTGLAFSTDGKYVATVASDHTIIISKL